MDKLIVGPLVRSAISTVIVIDALDECRDEESTSAVLSVLGQFVSQLPKVKFFLTGRPEPRIREGFRLPLLATETDVFVLHEVESEQVASDIRQFFGRTFSELKGRRHGLDGWPTEEQLDLLCKRAGGLFVYAVATVKFVDKQSGNPRKRLDLLLQSPEDSVHEGKIKFKANKTLDSLYLSILQEAFGDDPEDDPKIRSVIGAVILATNPLSPFTIATLLGFDTDDTFPLLSSIHSLLILHEDVDRPVQPFHKSFPDFIVDPARCVNQRFHVSPPDHHMELLVGCLELMNRRLEQNMCKLPDGVVNLEVDNLKERAEEYIGSGLLYACRSWHRHLVGTASIPAPGITSILHRFLEGKFLFWLEVLSVIGATREAIEALNTVAKWLDVCRVSILNLIPKFTHTRSRHHQLVHSSTTTFDLSLDSSKSSARPPRTSIIPLSSSPPVHRLCASCTNGTPDPWRGSCGGYRSHGNPLLRPRGITILITLGRLCGHRAAGSSQLPGSPPRQ